MERIYEKKIAQEKLVALEQFEVVRAVARCCSAHKIPFIFYFDFYSCLYERLRCRRSPVRVQSGPPKTRLEITKPMSGVFLLGLLHTSLSSQFLRFSVGCSQASPLRK